MTSSFRKIKFSTSHTRLPPFRGFKFIYNDLSLLYQRLQDTLAPGRVSFGQMKVSIPSFERRIPFTKGSAEEPIGWDIPSSLHISDQPMGKATILSPYLRVRHQPNQIKIGRSLMHDDAQTFPCGCNTWAKSLCDSLVVAHRSWAQYSGSDAVWMMVEVQISEAGTQRHDY